MDPMEERKKGQGAADSLGSAARLLDPGKSLAAKLVDDRNVRCLRSNGPIKHAIARAREFCSHNRPLDLGDCAIGGRLPGPGG